MGTSNQHRNGVSAQSSVGASGEGVRLRPAMAGLRRDGFRLRPAKAGLRRDEFSRFAERNKR
jgi:hypothetical protein